MNTEIVEATEIVELIQEVETFTEVVEVVQESGAVTEVVENIIYQCEHCGTIVELLEDILVYMETLVTFSTRFSQVLEFLLAFLVAVVFCTVCYIFLKNFTRF